MYLVSIWCSSCLSLFFFNPTAPTEIYTLSLHDALPICHRLHAASNDDLGVSRTDCFIAHNHGLHAGSADFDYRSEEHTSELQSRSDLVCRLLLEKKKKTPFLHW